MTATPLNRKPKPDPSHYLDRLHTITNCLEAVNQLLLPETSLDMVDRDKLASLVMLLLEEQRAALQMLLL